MRATALEAGVAVAVAAEDALGAAVVFEAVAVGAAVLFEAWVLDAAAVVVAGAAVVCEVDGCDVHSRCFHPSSEDVFRQFRH
jgi:hypothetical protein